MEMNVDRSFNPDALMAKRLDLARAGGNAEKIASVQAASDELAKKENSQRFSDAHELNETLKEDEKRLESAKNRLKIQEIVDAWIALAKESREKDPHASNLVAGVDSYLQRMTERLADVSGHVIYKSRGFKSPEEGIYAETFGEGAFHMLPNAMKEFGTAELVKRFGKENLLGMQEEAAGFLRRNRDMGLNEDRELLRTLKDELDKMKE